MDEFDATPAREDMPSSDVLLPWRDWYPDAPPVGFLLRAAYPNRWLRIHSLPDGKRHPTSGFEYAELLRRHNAAAEDVLGATSPCAILLLHTCRGRGVRAVGRAAKLTGTGLPRLAHLPVHLSDAGSGVFAAPMCIFGLRTTWIRGAFDHLISETAEDRTRGLVVNLDSGCVYAPYDGGADLFYVNETARDEARGRLAAWLSARADGL